MLAHRHSRIPMLQARPQPPWGVMAGPASRSRLASRFQKDRGQRSENRPQRCDRAHLRRKLEGPRRQKTAAHTPARCLLSLGSSPRAGSLASAPGGGICTWWGHLHLVGASAPGGGICTWWGHLHLVGLGRFERPTSRLSGVRSDQLSYRPRIRGRNAGGRRQPGPAHRRPVWSAFCPLRSAF
jgi:hypothetical protein